MISSCTCAPSKHCSYEISFRAENSTTLKPYAPIFFISNWTQIETLVFCYFRLSSCLIYNGVAYFGGCLDLFDQFETLKLLNIFSIEGLGAYFQLLIKKIGVSRLWSLYKIIIIIFLHLRMNKKYFDC